MTRFIRSAILAVFLPICCLAQTNPPADSLLAALDLSRPELADVRNAADAGAPVAARTAFARYLRSRTTPKWFFDPSHPPKDCDAGDRAAADAALEHRFTPVGIEYRFDGPIDWRFNPTTQPGSTIAVDNEWTWQFNRHNPVRSLARAFNATGDAKYGREATAEIAAWIAQNPPPSKLDNGPGSRWRTIECGIRMGEIWPEIYFRLLRSPEVMTDDLLLSMVNAMREHAEYLDAFPSRSGNWLTMESNGLFHVGALFPEFKQAATWREHAAARQRRELDVQVYPDGAQIELAPGYHFVSLKNFLWTMRLAQLEGMALPDGYLASTQRMFDMAMWAMTPARGLPPLNDSGSVDVERALADGLKIFPQRRDWTWIASQGKEGAAPAETSHLFPYAGWCVMRSGWDRDARYLLMEGGPFGYAHQHEDKLSFVLHAFGSELVCEAGSFAYDASAMRKYVLSARAHNVVYVDGLEQNRRRSGHPTEIVTAPVRLIWKSDDLRDYACATYGGIPGEPWGPERVGGFVHQRQIVFVRPDYWLIVDTLTPPDEQPHRYESTFHLNAPDATLDSSDKRVATVNPQRANLLIVPAEPEALDARIIKGQTEPFMQGWISSGAAHRPLEPRPTVYFTRKGQGVVRFVYAFVP